MPRAPQRRSVPVVWSSVCTSPCPCGFVSSEKTSCGSSAKAAVSSSRHATFSCFISVTWLGSSPKKLSFSSSARVLSAVSSETMIASGSRTGADAAASVARCSAERIWRQYQER